MASQLFQLQVRDAGRRIGAMEIRNHPAIAAVWRLIAQPRLPKLLCAIAIGMMGLNAASIIAHAEDMYSAEVLECTIHSIEWGGDSVARRIELSIVNKSRRLIRVSESSLHAAIRSVTFYDRKGVQWRFQPLRPDTVESVDFERDFRRILPRNSTNKISIEISGDQFLPVNADLFDAKHKISGLGPMEYSFFFPVRASDANLKKMRFGDMVLRGYGTMEFGQAEKIAQ